MLYEVITDTMTSGNAHDYNNDGEHMVALSVFHDYSRDLTFGVDGRIGLGMEYQGVQLHPTEELALVGIWHPAVFPKFSRITSYNVCYTKLLRQY